jgi:hypothetical protein
MERIRGYGKITKPNLRFQSNKNLRLSAFICGLFFKICRFIFRQTISKVKLTYKDESLFKSGNSDLNLKIEFKLSWAGVDGK